MMEEPSKYGVPPEERGGPPMRRHDICGRECPRHDGKVCQIAYVPQLVQDGVRKMGIPVVDASMRHRHTHTEPFTPHAVELSVLTVTRHYLISHSWGGKRGHSYAFGQHTLHGVDEALYDAILAGEVDPEAVEKELNCRQAEVWKAGGGLLQSAGPLSLEEFLVSA